MLELAMQHQQAGRLAEAESLYRQILSQEPRNADALHLLGMLAHQTGNNAVALQLIQQAIAINPTSADFRTDLARVLMAMNRRTEAAEAAREGVRLNPESAMGQYILGQALGGIGRLEEGIAHFRRAVDLKPDFFDAIQTLGSALRHLGRPGEAAICYQRCVSLRPEAPKPHNNLGVTLWESGQIEESLAAYQQGLELHPSYAEMHWGYALYLLTTGNFKTGWEEWEWGLRSWRPEFNRGVSKSIWDGSDFSGKTLLLHAEGGFGDAIHFIRYVPMIAQRGGIIMLECQRELASLLGQVPGIERVIVRGEALPKFDFHIQLQSLPRIFKTELATIPASVPYLAASPQIAQVWAERLHAEPESLLKVGLVWAGSNAIGEDQRSRALDIFTPLGAIPGVRFYSLQKGPDARQPVPSGLLLMDYTSDLHDFADLAGLIANLDLVISVDTSVAHLAGALARPVWTLIPHKCDFRWLLEREDSPWYPTMRLFRQKKDQPWNALVIRIAKELPAETDRDQARRDNEKP
jgi:tetratricopeptide (TPR) repeat protein